MENLDLTWILNLLFEYWVFYSEVSLYFFHHQNACFSDVSFLEVSSLWWQMLLVLPRIWTISF